MICILVVMFFFYLVIINLLKEEQLLEVDIAYRTSPDNETWGEWEEPKEKSRIDYNNLNYTTLNISREDFEKLSEFRQRSWLMGDCYPEDCKIPNPPYCSSYYLVYCFNPTSPGNQYFNQRYLEVK